MDHLNEAAARPVASAGEDAPHLTRVLTLPMLVLYGLGVTVGAGIYVLIGAAAERAGVYAPAAFLLAAAVMAFTAASFAEFSGRLPVSAGEAAYVREGFQRSELALLVGLLVVTSGTISCAAISVGSAGYIRVFVNLPAPLIITAVVVIMAAIAAWGIMESVSFAGVMTAIEILGLLVVIAAGLYSDPGVVLRFTEVFPATLDTAIWSGVLSATLLAFFAFVGFEDLVNVAEEARDPNITMPRAIFWTLLIALVLYFLVVSIAVLLVPTNELAASEAPLSLVFERLTGASPLVVAGIAVIATLNGIIIQMIMASRVLYGLSQQGALTPAANAIFGKVNARTHTPLVATATVAAIVLTLALVFPIAGLAEMTSRFTLAIFALVNLALILVKRRDAPAPEGVVKVPAWVPWCGLASSVALLVVSLVA